MLTKKENFLETIHGGTPDRYVDNFEFMTLVFDCISAHLNPEPKIGVPYQNAWGVWNVLAEGEPGPMPLTDDDHKLITDVTEWRDQIKTPQIIFSDEDWAPFEQMAKDVDRNETFVAPFLGNGIFEKMHYFMGMEDAMCNLYEEPEAMHDLIDYAADWEIKQAEEIVKHMHPDAIFHHDDWGSQKNSFMAPEMFEEFLVPAYEKVYGFWKENGVEIIVHHSDSYCYNLLEYFPRMQIDVWQGAVDTNDIPKCVAEWGDKVTIMGGLNNGIYDKPDTQYETILEGFRNLVNSCPNQGKHYLLPGLTMGGNWSVFDGVYDMCSKACEQVSKENF